MKKNRGKIELVRKRNVGLAVILTIITCGIYALYWFIRLTDELSTLSRDDSMDGGKALFFTVVTFGIYHLYWNYKIGQMMYAAQENAGIRATDRSIIHLLMGL